MQDFTRLQVWEKAHALALEVYHGFGARRGNFTGLRSQVLRAASSIPTNIVEGCGKRTAGEFLRYLEIAIGSSQELEYHLLLARDLGIIERTVQESLAARTQEVRRMLHGLCRRIRDRQAQMRVMGVQESVFSDYALH